MTTQLVLFLFAILSLFRSSFLAAQSDFDLVSIIPSELTQVYDGRRLVWELPGDFSVPRKQIAARKFEVYQKFAEALFKEFERNRSVEELFVSGERTMIILRQVVDPMIEILKQTKPNGKLMPLNHKQRLELSYSIVGILQSVLTKNRYPSYTETDNALMRFGLLIGLNVGMLPHGTVLGDEGGMLHALNKLTFIIHDLKMNLNHSEVFANSVAGKRLILSNAIKTMKLRQKQAAIVDAVAKWLLPELGEDPSELCQTFVHP